VRRHLLALALVTGCGHAPPANPITTIDPTSPVRVLYLDNGLTVSLYRNARGPLVYMMSAYELGTDDDPVGMPGMARTAARLFVEGHGATSSQTFAERLAPATILAGVWVDAPTIQTYAETLATDLDAAIAIEADRMTLGCGGIDDAAFGRALQGAAPAADARPALERIVARAVYGARHPLARTTFAARPAFDRAEACAFVEDRVGADAARVTIAGNIDLDHVEQVVRAAFGGVRAARVHRPTLAPPLGPGRIELTADVVRTMVVVTAAGPSTHRARDIVEDEIHLTRRDAILELGDGDARSLSVVVGVDDPALIAASTDRAIAAMTALSNRSLVVDPPRGSAWFEHDFVDAPYEALVELARDPGWLPGERHTDDSPFDHDAFRADRLRIAIIHPSGHGSIRTSARWRVGVVHLASDTDVSAPVDLPAAPLVAIEHRRLDNGVGVVVAPQPAAMTMGAAVVFPVGDRVLEPFASPFNLVALEDAGLWTATLDNLTGAEVTAFTPPPDPPIDAMWTFLTTAIDKPYKPATPYEPPDCPRSSYRDDPRSHAYELVHRKPRPQVDAAMVRQYRESYLRPDTAAIIAVGAVTPDAVIADAQRTFGTWRATDASAPPAPSAPAALPGRTWRGIVDRRSDTVSIAIAFPRKSTVGPDTAARMIADTLIQGLASVRPTDALTFEYNVDRDDAATTITELMHRLDVVRTDPAALGAELAVARRHALAMILQTPETSDAMLEALELTVAYDLPDDFYDRLARDVLTVTPDEIAAVAARDFDPAHMVIVMRGEKPDLELALTAAGAAADAIEWREIPDCH
jgi:predicted Zn-dependent peptidase